MPGEAGHREHHEVMAGLAPLAVVAKEEVCSLNKPCALEENARPKSDVDQHACGEEDSEEGEDSAGTNGDGEEIVYLHVQLIPARCVEMKQEALYCKGQCQEQYAGLPRQPNAHRVIRSMTLAGEQKS